MGKIKLRTILEKLELNLDLSEELLNLEVEDYQYNSFEYENGAYNILSDAKYPGSENWGPGISKRKGIIRIVTAPEFRYPEAVLSVCEGDSTTYFKADGTINSKTLIN